MEGYDADSGKFPSVKIPRFMSPVGFQARQEGGETSNAPSERYHSLNLDLHTNANNFAPNESERLSIPPGLLFTKDQMQGEK